MNSLKKIKLRYWLIGSILLGTILLMLAIRAQFVDVPLRVAPETTYVTSPLKAHGSHDFTGLSSNHYGIHFGPRDGSVQRFNSVSGGSVDEQVLPILRATSSKSAFD